MRKPEQVTYIHKYLYQASSFNLRKEVFVPVIDAEFITPGFKTYKDSNFVLLDHCSPQPPVFQKTKMHTIQKNQTKYITGLALTIRVIPNSKHTQWVYMFFSCLITTQSINYHRSRFPRVNFPPPPKEEKTKTKTSIFCRVYWLTTFSSPFSSSPFFTPSKISKSSNPAKP